MDETSNWQALENEWRARKLLQDWDAEFGAKWLANETFDVAMDRLKQQFGSASHPDARPGRDAAWAVLQPAESAWYDDFIAPADEAALTLIQAPAPNEAAILLKAEIIREHELNNNANAPDDLIGILRDDFARLGYLRIAR